MSHTRLAILTIAALGIMLGMNALSRNETLETANGVSAATVLPLDQSTSTTAFQTATFGLG